MHFSKSLKVRISLTVLWQLFILALANGGSDNTDDVTASFIVLNFPFILYWIGFWIWGDGYISHVAGRVISFSRVKSAFMWLLTAFFVIIGWYVGYKLITSLGYVIMGVFDVESKRSIRNIESVFAIGGFIAGFLLVRYFSKGQEAGYTVKNIFTNFRTKVSEVIRFFINLDVITLLLIGTYLILICWYSNEVHAGDLAYGYPFIHTLNNFCSVRFAEVGISFDHAQCFVA